MEDKLEHGEIPSMDGQRSQTNTAWKKELQRHQSKVEILQEKLKEVMNNIQCSEGDAEKELEVLWHRVKASTTLLTYLKSKARIIAVPHLAHASCGIKHEEGVGLVDRDGIPLSRWSKDIDLSSFESSNEEHIHVSSYELGALAGKDGAYTGEILKSVHLITGVMESLVKRVIMAETEVVTEKEKVNVGLEEIRRKTVQVENMSAKVEEMEILALGAKGVLNEMRQKVEDMVQETSRQRQRAAENEEELCRVKHDFESLRSYVSSLINVRETLLSSEKQFQTMEKLFDRLIAKTSHLESEKVQKEAEVRKLIEENVMLRATLDKKEAQLLAMNEQCKFMALSKPGI